MANTFKNAAAAATGTALTDIYTCANVTTTNPIKVNIKFYDASANNNFFIVKNAEIFEGGALVAVGGDQKLVLETGDKIKVSSDTAGSVDTIVSVMEQT